MGNCDISELATGLFTQLVEIVDGSLHVPRNIEQLSMDALEAPCTTVIKNKIFYICILHISAPGRTMCDLI